MYSAESSALCDDLDGWEGDPRGKGYIQMYVCVYIADLLSVQQKLAKHCKAIVPQ